MDSTSRPTNRNFSSRRQTTGSRVRALTSCLVAGGCLFWIFHNIHPGQFFGAMGRIRWRGLVLGILLQFLAYLCVAWEWQLLLRPAGTLSWRRAAQAVFAGRFANDALPMQLGYLVRAILAARWMGVSVISIFPSLIIERLWDGIWLAVGIGLVAILLPLPSSVLHAATIFGIIVLAGTGAIVCVIFLRGKTPAGPAAIHSRWKFARRVRLAIRNLADGMREIGHSGLLPQIVGLSVVKLGIQAAAFLSLLWAYDLHLPVAVGLAVFFVGYLGICIPSTPAGTGMFQLFVVAGLTIFGIGKSVAAGFALVAFVVITVPLAVAGFFALVQSGLRLRQIRSEAGQLRVSA